MWVFLQGLSTADAIATFVALVSAVQTAFIVATFFLARTIKHATNSIMDQRLAETRVSSEAKGELVGREKEKEERGLGPSITGLVILTILLTFPSSSDGGQVRSRSGVVVSVSDRAQGPLQCVVDYLEAHKVRIKSMRGRGSGTVSGSLHPSGDALDVNQTDRDRTSPAVPRHLSNAAADACGVVSGARWTRDPNGPDNGHWNLHRTARARPARGVRIARPYQFPQSQMLW